MVCINNYPPPNLLPVFFLLPGIQFQVLSIPVDVSILGLSLDICQDDPTISHPGLCIAAAAHDPLECVDCGVVLQMSKLLERERLYIATCACGEI